MIPADLSRLSNVVDNDITHWYIIDKSGLEKTTDDADKKMPDTSGLVKKTDYDAKITGIEGKIPSITCFTTISALNVVENKIHNVNDLVKKTDYDTTISDIEAKYLTTSDYNKFTVEILNKNIKEKRLVDKFVISGIKDNNDLDKKNEKLATKAELK